MSGRRLGAATRVAALKLRTIAPTTATGIPIAAKGRNVTAKMRFTGALDAGSLAVLDSAIADGRAVVQVWQGGIKTSVARRRAAGLGVRIAESPARLVVVLTAKPRRFVSLRTRLTDHGRAVLFQLRKAPPPRPRVVSRPSVTPRPSQPRYVPPRPPAPKYEPIPLP